jgi:hypothetical protein
MKHFTEFLPKGHAFDVLMCPSAWHCEHCTRVGLLIHLQIVTSLPKRAALSLLSVLVMVPSESDTANVMVEYAPFIPSTGLSHQGSMARWAFLSPGMVLTSLRSSSGP